MPGGPVKCGLMSCGSMSHKSDLALLDALVCRGAFTITQTSVHEEKLQPAIQLGSGPLISKHDRVVSAQLVSMGSGMRLTSLEVAAVAN